MKFFKEKSNFLLIISVLVLSFEGTASSKKYLFKVLDRLQKIESATYYLTQESWAPGDTVASSSYQSFYKEYNNPTDTTIGASFVKLDKSDLTTMHFIYDGNMRAYTSEQNKTITIDSFMARPLPFRPINAPFFNYSKHIIEYALHTQDSTNLNFKEEGSYIYMKLTIFHEKQVEFFGKAHYLTNPSVGYEEELSIYEIWMDKVSDLPVKIRRVMSHNISVLSMTDYELNHLDIKNFIATDFFPENYDVHLYRSSKSYAPPQHQLTYQKAPTWILTSTDGDEVNLESLSGKAILLQFTSVNCGPCKLSIPFLNSLLEEYEEKQLTILMIESSNRNMEVLKAYVQRNGIKNQFLMSKDDVIEHYSITSYPIFFILNEDRFITKVIYGYKKRVADVTIRKVIEELL